MIQIKNLQKYFLAGENKIKIFSNLNINILDGEFISLIGPSGSGKSTFLNIISGIDRDFEGELKIEGKNIKNLSDDEITQFRGKNISYIFQNFKLIENLTVGENIDLIVELNNLERNFETKEILKIVGLESKKDTYAFNLSGGESQRVAVARAFVGKTKLLLADEPTGSLDQENKKIIMDLIIKLHNKTKNTIILITHDDEVAKLAGKIYKVGGGKLFMI
ncbi:MAG: ABC transporter ATP-binding protein [Candidatus Gracilibacteria bacterium]|nr:ABC transporter ATP-binding protein [Candidatus Gracilibacteria bacterium]